MKLKGEPVMEEDICNVISSTMWEMCNLQTKNRSETKSPDQVDNISNQLYLTKTIWYVVVIHDS